MNNAASVKARLRNLAIRSQMPYEYVLTHYMIERLLNRLSNSRFAGDFVLKGGLLLHALLADDARATRDIDLLGRSVSNAPGALNDIFAEICALPVDDAVSFEPSSIVTEEITEGADYPGTRLKLVGYIERTRSTLQFDIGFGDAVVPKPAEMIYPSLLGLDETRLLAYSKDRSSRKSFKPCCIWRKPTAA